MNKKAKKVIAREGLIIITVGIAGLIVFIVREATWSSYAIQDATAVWLTYPCYLVIRFIVWAIKTLRKKES